MMTCLWVLMAGISLYSLVKVLSDGSPALADEKRFGAAWASAAMTALLPLLIYLVTFSVAWLSDRALFYW